MKNNSLNKLGKFSSTCLLLLVLSASSLYSKRLEVFPDMNPSGINETIKNLVAGDSLVFNQGTYKGPFLLDGIHGELNNPIVIQGVYENGKYLSIIDGETKPASSTENNAFRLEGSSWIEIKFFQIENCWTDVIYANESSYLSIASCDITGGKRALYATGRNSHHFLIENCVWEQDIRVWDHSEGYSWEEVHHGIHAHYNGSLFQGQKISGGFVLRNNIIKNTFNAFRVSPVNDGYMDSLASTNGEIYNNTIINTSDNVLEPEVFCHNLFFYHNTIINGHAFFSFTGVAGGYVYIYGNTAISMPDSDDGWTIFKISKDSRPLTNPFYVFNNSWYVDFDIVGRSNGKWENDHVFYFNNAHFIENQKEFGIFRTGNNNSFDYDCSNLSFPKWFKKEGHEKNGIENSPEYLNPLKGDFRLNANSPCIDKGKIDSLLIPFYEGSAPDIGAYDNNKLIFGMPFRYEKELIEVPFTENPRITRYEIKDSILKLWFSTPVDNESLKSCSFKLREGSSEYTLNFMEEESEEYEAVFSFENVLKTENIELILSGLAYGKNGEILTSWASAIPIEFKAYKEKYNYQ